MAGPLDLCIGPLALAPDPTVSHDLSQSRGRGADIRLIFNIRSVHSTIVLEFLGSYQPNADIFVIRKDIFVIRSFLLRDIFHQGQLERL